jgi:hypothetical protein
VKRNTIQHLDVDSTLNDESFDDVKAVKLRFAVCDIRQVPAPRWWRPADLTRLVQGATTLENPTDGANRRDAINVLAHQFVANRLGAVLAKNTVLSKLPAKLENPVLHVAAGPRCPMWNRRLCLPIHTIKSLT